MRDNDRRRLGVLAGIAAVALAVSQLSSGSDHRDLARSAAATNAGLAPPTNAYVENLPGVTPGVASPEQRRANTSLINAALARGAILRLRAGSLIQISSSLILPTGSGLVGDAGAVKPVIFMPASSFTNRDDQAGTGRYSPTAVAINFSGQLSGGHVPSRGVRLENLSVRSEDVGGRRLRAIVGQNVTDCTIRNVEVSDIPSGVGIALSSARNCLVSDVYVHDFHDKAQWTFSPQSTGIEVDNDLINDIPSEGVTIRRFRISDITVEGASLARWGYQTDGINIVNSRSRTAIEQGQISNVGEGIDTFGSDGSISDVVIRDAYIFGLKFIHGASRNAVRNVTITNAGLAGVIFAGSNAARTDTSGNVITGLIVKNIDPDGVWKENSTGGIIVSGRGTVRRPTNNRVVDAHIDLGPNGKYGWVDGSTGSGNRASGFTVVPGRSLDRKVLIQNGGSVVDVRP